MTHDKLGIHQLQSVSTMAKTDQLPVFIHAHLFSNQMHRRARMLWGRERGLELDRKEKTADLKLLSLHLQYSMQVLHWELYQNTSGTMKFM